MSKHVIYLEKRNPMENQARFYLMHLVSGLFGDWSFVRQWGRSGNNGPRRVTTDWFDTFEEAQEAMQGRARQKVRRGYQELSG